MAHPHASTTADLNPIGEMLGELDAIGAAILGVIGSGGQRIAVTPLVERLQFIAGALADGVDPEEPRHDVRAFTPI